MEGFVGCEYGEKNCSCDAALLSVSCTVSCSVACGLLGALTAGVKLAIGNHSPERNGACENAGAGHLRQAVCDEAEHLLVSFRSAGLGVKESKDSPRGQRLGDLRLRSDTRREGGASPKAMMSVGAFLVSSCGQPRRATALPATLSLH